MQIISVIQAGPRDQFPVQLREAALAAFPGAQWTELENPEPEFDGGAFIPPPLSPPGTGEAAAGRGVLVIFGNDSPLAVKTAALLDPDQLPLCGVVVFGCGEAALPKENWSFPQLIHALRSAAGRHFQERDNAALRGNLLTMARRVSHDLRTPLGGVIATVDMLAEITPGGPAAVKPLFSSVDEITAIISRTSFLLKAIAQPAAAVPVNMAGSVREAQLRLERQITRRQATIRTAASWPVVSAVESWLEVIWWNLLQNSLKHAGDQPVIELSWESIEGGHRFWIRDNGPGVPAAAQERLFQSFHTLHDPNGPRGFGLAIVRGLVELMGGTCGREPQPPTGGAGFYFTLQETI